MICDQFTDSVELYALGALESPEANALAEHLATGCPVCHEALRRALSQISLVSHDVPLVDPPARLRRRVQEAIAPSPVAAPWLQWLPWAVAVAALVTLAVGLTLENHTRSSENQIAPMALAENPHVANMLQILGAPGTTKVAFTDPKSKQLFGTLYIHQKLGLALVIDSLPTAPQGWKYESWLVPKVGKPQPVEPFQPDQGGRALSIVPGPVDVANTAEVAVSMEPQNSNPVKPTTLVFAVKI